MIIVRRYSQDKIQEWNSFLPFCKNHTFFFNRNYMDYHSDRFIDYSLMVYEDNKLVCILPASLNSDNTSITSHAGLTYGSIVVEKSIRSIKTIEYTYNIVKYLFEKGILIFNLKQMPVFYNTAPSDEIDYALFILDAFIYRIDIASAINLNNKLAYQERRVRSIKKAEKLNICIIEESDCCKFWEEVLTPNLLERFGVKPVHSLREITQLMQDNRPHIRQFNAYCNNRIVAGCTIFETTTTAHAQYISGTEEGRRNGGLDLLFHELISKYFSHKSYFDFGIVNEQQGRQINVGLLDWKEGFGARAYAHRFYRVDTRSYIKLEVLLN